MTKRTFFAGATAAILLSGIAVLDAQRVGGNAAQGRRGPAGPPALQQGQLGQRQGPRQMMAGRRGQQLLGAPGRGIGGRMGRGGRMGGGPLAGLKSVGLTDAQQTQVKAIFDAAEAERLAARTKTENAILAILTPEQKAKLGKK